MNKKLGSMWGGWGSNPIIELYGVCLWKYIGRGWGTFSWFSSFSAGALEYSFGTIMVWRSSLKEAPHPPP